MSDYSRNNRYPEDSIEETRRKKMEEFRRSFDKNAVRGDYDVDPFQDSVPSVRGDADYSDDGFFESYGQPASHGYERSSQGVYDDEVSSTSYSKDRSTLKKKRRSNEINSFSDSDTKKRIERDSEKALKQQKKEEKKLEKQKAKRNRRIFKWVWLAMVILVGVVLAQFLLVGVNDMLAISREANPQTVNVSIPANPNIDQIADILTASGVIRKPEFFKLYANFTTKDPNFRQGEYQIATNKDYEALINFLQSNNNRTDIVTVQITEGMNALEIAQLLHEEGVTADIQQFLDVCNSNDFDEDYTFLQNIKNADKRYYKLEGYLFPDTYDFYLGEDPKLTIGKLLSNYENKVVLHKEKYFGNSKKSTLEGEMVDTGYSMDEILTIASIIQAEAANKDDMYYISSILHNRLDYGGELGVARLNCDCTVYYPYREYSDVPDSIRATYVSTYNTNDFEGLPPGPICNPSLEAIKAAISPYDTEYIFFCHASPEDGSTPYYATNIYDHEYNLTLIGIGSYDDSDDDDDYDYYY